jgi:hypothetical protein
VSPKNEFALRAKHPIFAAPAGVPKSRFALDGIAVGDGWAAILDELATEIEQHCAARGNQLRGVLQIKEKFGALRVNVGKVDDGVRAIITRAEHRSASNCEICGTAGRLRNAGGWLRTRCEEHVDQGVGEIV